jgi:hypothetical protein
MQIYRSWEDRGYHLEIKVPSEESEKLQAEIIAYKGKKLFERVYFKMDRIPSTICDATNMLILTIDEYKRMDRRLDSLVSRLK